MSEPIHSSNSLHSAGESGCLIPHLLIRKQWKHGHPFMSVRPLGSVSSVIACFIMYLSSCSCVCIIRPSDIRAVRANVICFLSIPSFSTSSSMPRPSCFADLNSLRIRSSASFIEMTFDKTHGNVERTARIDIK